MTHKSRTIAVSSLDGRTLTLDDLRDIVNGATDAGYGGDSALWIDFAYDADAHIYRCTDMKLVDVPDPLPDPALDSDGALMALVDAIREDSDDTAEERAS